ncbi:MAG: hypothetical protein KGI57_12425, partial [Hyphomicrobiales bacterium]|nr:hypothetical protein [Hyphomicrobiales bacterium]
MDVRSPLYDKIRAGKRRMEAPKPEAPRCEAPGCTAEGLHRAPRGRGEEGYRLLCLDHVRAFNAGYDYFRGMSDAEVERFQREAIVGHRPTRPMGARQGAGAPETADPRVAATARS